MDEVIRPHPLFGFLAPLLSLEIWVVGLLAAGSFILTALLPWTLVAAGAFCLLRVAIYGRLSVRTPVDIPVGLLLLTLPVTLWATALPEITIPQVYRLLSGIALFYAVVNWCDRPSRLRLLQLAVAGVAVVLALGALVGVEWPGNKIPLIPASLYARFPILLSDTANPNVMAGTLVVLLPVMYALPLFGSRKIPRWLQALVLLAALAATALLVLTQSRGALLALAAGLALLVLLRWRYGWLLFVAGFAAAAYAVVSLSPERILNLVVASTTLGGVEGRIEVWSRAIYMIQDFAFTGVGMGSYMQVADLLYPFFLHGPGKIAHAHNLFLQVAVDLGIPGLIAWLSILLLVTFSDWRLYRQSMRIGNHWAAGLAAGLLCSQVALVTHGLLDAVTWGMVRPAPLIWVLWGLAIAASLRWLPASKTQEAAEESLPAEISG